jgi:thiol:disulfide interchange protein DsbD
MLGLSILMLGKVISPESTMLLWSLFFMGIAFYMGVFDNASARVGMKKLFHLLAFTSLIYGAVLFVGFLTDAKSILHPLEKFTSSKVVQGAVAIKVKPETKSGYSIAKLEAEVKASSKPVIVDFRKKSCASCDELESFTLSNPAVKKEMERFTFISIDVTANTDDEQALLRHYKAFGTPSILFFDKEHKALPSKNISGFVNAEKFLKHLKTIH